MKKRTEEKVDSTNIQKDNPTYQLLDKTTGQTLDILYSKSHIDSLIQANLVPRRYIVINESKSKQNGE